MKKSLRMARWMLSVTNRKSNRETVLGDFEEFYNEVRAEKGPVYAHIWFYAQALKSIPRFLFTSFYWGVVMFNNYIKIIFRNIINQKAFSIINILGLAIGITVCMLSIVYIEYELSYDTYHKKAENIYRVTRQYDTPSGYKAHFARCPEQWINNLPDEFPEIEKLVRFQWTPSVNLKIGENKLRSFKWYFTDADVFNVFSFKMLKGDPSTALSEPYSVVLTKEMSKKYFAASNSVGKELILVNEGSGEYVTYKVTGVIDDIPSNSHFQIEFLASYPRPEARQGWAWVYLLLNNKTDPEALEKKLPDFIKKYGGQESFETSILHLQALTDIHLYSHLDREIEQNGEIQYVYIFGAVALLTILIAGFNFMNLSTARSVKRSKEIGIRKVLGAERKQLVSYFLAESVFFSVTAFFISILIVVLVFPYFNKLFGNVLTLEYVFYLPLVLGFFFLSILAGIFSGSYPAVVLSSFNPVNAFTNGTNLSGSGKRLNFIMRRALVVLQFTISIVLIIFTLFCYNQYSFIKNKKLGLKKEQILAVTNVPNKDKIKYPVLKSELENYNGITGVTACMDVPSRDILDAGFTQVEGVHTGDESTVLSMQSVDDNFIDVMGIKLLAGENFHQTGNDKSLRRFNNLTEMQNYVRAKEFTYLLNESAVKKLGWNSNEEALGKKLTWANNAFSHSGRIVGVVEDFHYASLHLEIRPLILVCEPLWQSNFLIKVSRDNIQTTLSHIGKVWEQIYPDTPFQYEFLDDMFDALYRTEERQGELLSVFSVLAIFIAYLGLYGLVAYTAEQRTKEIGIRKVMGASVPKVVFLLIKEFAKWILLANLIAVPVGYYIISRWLENFAYRINISFELFILAGGLSFIIAFVTICYQTIKAASVNPVNSLRYE